MHTYAMHACMYTCMFAFMSARNTPNACTFPESDERAVYVLMYAFLRVSTYVFVRDFWNIHRQLLVAVPGLCTSRPCCSVLC